MNPTDLLASTLAQLNNLTVNPLAAASAPTKLGYVYSPEQLALSYSRLQTFYSCPRKFQFKELNQSGNFEPNIDTAFGHAFAAGVQELWRSGSIERAYLAAIAAWSIDAFTDIWGKKKDKSLYCALQSIEDYETNVLLPQQADGWRLAEVGIEALCYLQVTPTINYQAHLDLILEHIETGSLKLVEIKTSARPHLHATWQNSLQTKGYYALLSYIAGTLGRAVWPELEYHCLQTGKLADPMLNYGLQVLVFCQEEVAPGEFILQLLQDVRQIEGYVQDNHFPLRGNSCVSGWGQVCEFFGDCQNVERLQQVEEGLYESLTLADCHYVINLPDLIAALAPGEELEI